MLVYNYVKIHTPFHIPIGFAVNYVAVIGDMYFSCVTSVTHFLLSKGENNKTVAFVSSCYTYNLHKNGTDNRPDLYILRSFLALSE